MISEALKAASVIAPEHLEPKTRTSKTWKLDKVNKRVASSYIDDMEALKQAIYINLNVERQTTFIHTNGFGTQFAKLAGQSKNLAKARLPMIIKDALAWDERIVDITDFRFTDIDKTKILVEFTVTSIYGEFDTEAEVNV